MRSGKPLLPSTAGFLFVVLFLFLCSEGRRLLNDGDTGYHIRVGEYILDRHAIPDHDLYAFYLPPLPWTAHEWLSEVLMAGLHRMGGLTAVVLFFALLIALSYALLAAMMVGTGANAILATLGAAVAAAASALHWLARPHVFTLIFLVLWYRFLEEYRLGRSDRLRLLPLTMLLWVNLHGGFIIGLVVCGIYLAGELVRSGFSLDGRVRRLSGMLAACGAATLVNPHGFRILLFPFTLVSDRYISDHVAEFVSPNFHDPLLFTYLLFAMIVLLAAAPVRAEPVELVLCLLFTAMALRSLRHIPLFAIIVVPVLVRKTEELLAASRRGFASTLRQRLAALARVDQGAGRFLWPAVAVAAVLVLTARGSLAYSFDPELKPVAAVEFLAREPVPGNMYNNDEFGDYLIYAGSGRFRVALDGRLDMYGATRMREYAAVVDLEAGWEDVLERYRVGWLFFPTKSLLARHLWSSPDWHPLYADPVAVIFVRKNPEYLPLIGRHPRPAELPREKGSGSG